MTGNFIHEHGKGFAFLLRGTDIQKYQFIGPLGSIIFSKLDRVTGIAEVFKVDAFDGSTGLDVQTGDDPLGQHATIVVSSDQLI